MWDNQCKEDVQNSLDNVYQDWAMGLDRFKAGLVSKVDNYLVMWRVEMQKPQGNDAAPLMRINQAELYQEIG